jgi:hypothetical protein
LTIGEIEFLVASIVLEHHASFHEGIGTSPEAKWASETEGRCFRMPQDLRTFHRDFLPFEERKVQRDGIHLFGISYWHDALAPLLNNKLPVTVHYDHANLSKVFIRGRSGAYIEVPYRNLRRPPISKWELRAATRALRREGRAGVDESMIFDRGGLTAGLGLVTGGAEAERAVVLAGRLNGCDRESALLGLQLLQTDHIPLRRRQPVEQIRQPLIDVIDVEGGDPHLLARLRPCPAA